MGIFIMSEINMSMNIRLELKCEDPRNLEESLINNEMFPNFLCDALCEILRKHSGNIQPSCICIFLETPQSKMGSQIVRGFRETSLQHTLRHLLQGTRRTQRK